MDLADDGAIERLTLGVIDRSLAKEHWTHAGHFAAALWLLRHRPELTTPAAVRALISGYNEATNTANSDSGGYHHSITLASLRAAADMIRRNPPGTPTHIILAAALASRLGDREWLLAFWRRETLFSVAARRGWIEPDLLSLPF